VSRSKEREEKSAGWSKKKKKNKRRIRSIRNLGNEDQSTGGLVDHRTIKREDSCPQGIKAPCGKGVSEAEAYFICLKAHLSEKGSVSRLRR